MFIISLVIFSQKLLIFFGKIQHIFFANFNLFFQVLKPSLSEKIYYTEQKQLMNVLIFAVGNHLKGTVNE